MIFGILFCTTVFAHTIEWYVGDNLLSTTTCESGDNITPPSAPAKYGYHFKGWLEYQPIEYLDISQGSFLQISYQFNTNTVFETRIAITENMSNDNGIFGNGWAQRSFLVIFINNRFKSYFNNSTGIENTKTIVRNIPYKLKIGNGFIDVDGFTVDGPQLNTLSASSLRIPYARVSGTFRFYYFQIYDNDTLVRDFIPVLDPDGIPCMYDKVERKFYYNAGTGQFIAGPAI